MAPELALGGLQHWLQAVIEAPGPVTRALASREAARLVRPGRTRDVVLPSKRLSADARVGVYQAMYLPRMLEALESDYPALAHFLGHAAWQRLVRAYVTAHPSRSYTLNELGRRLPEFVGRARVPRPAFCRDLARLEWAVAEVFDAPETPSLVERDLAAVAPGEWERARLVPVAALRLVELDHDAGTWLDSLKHETHRHPKVARRRSLLVVYRRNYGVMRREQTPAAFALLRDLVDGQPVGRAVARALGRRAAARLDGADAAFRLFREWAAMGLFQGVL
ncbi:MAG TPA: DNA-binding domain-containing protein [Vicinamibacteria bacterium]|nr:DNA-binding domain-containing protein [Vicinamibacteria bacterium]